MNKTLAITAIVLVAVVMGMSAIAPMIPQAFAHDVPDEAADVIAHEICFGTLVIPEKMQKFVCNH